MWELQVERANPRNVRVVGYANPDLATGEALLRVPWFGFSANNITYADLGDQLRYWEFFPREGGYGQIPVWGFAEVVASRADGVAEGDRVFGYLPMATGVVLSPGRVSDRGFTDTAPHRATLPAPYNRYARAGAPAPGDHLYALLRPLFVLAFLLDDHLRDNEFFGADRLLITSASSKAARATALLLASRPGPEVVGLTSAGRLDTIRASYHAVAGYDDPPAPNGGTVLIDIAGNPAVRQDLQDRYGAALLRTIGVGATHRQRARRTGRERRGAAGRPGRCLRRSMGVASVTAGSRSTGCGRSGRRCTRTCGWGAPAWTCARCCPGSPRTWFTSPRRCCSGTRARSPRGTSASPRWRCSRPTWPGSSPATTSRRRGPWCGGTCAGYTGWPRSPSYRPPPRAGGCTGRASGRSAAGRGVSTWTRSTRGTAARRSGPRWPRPARCLSATSAASPGRSGCTCWPRSPRSRTYGWCSSATARRGRPWSGGCRPRRSWANGAERSCPPPWPASTSSSTPAGTRPSARPYRRRWPRVSQWSRPRTVGPLDYVRHGENGWLWNGDDPDLLREQVATLAADPAARQAMGRRARDSVLGRSWAHFGDQLLAHYRSVLPTPAGRATVTLTPAAPGSGTAAAR